MEINSVANENVQYLPRLYSTVEYYENYSVELYSRKSWLFTVEVFWLNKFLAKDFVNFANINGRICLMPDGRGINLNGPDFAQKPSIQFISKLKITIDCLRFF